MRVFGAVIAAVLVCASATSAYAQPPVEAFGALPFLDQPQLSPDGKHFAGIQDLNGKPAAVIYTVGSADPPQVFASDNWLVSRVTWAKNDRLVMFTKTIKGVPFGNNPDQYTWYRAISLQVGGTDWVQLFGRNNDSVGINSSAAHIVDRNLGNPDEILMPLWTRPKNDRTDNDPTMGISGNYGGDYRFSLYRVDVRTGRATILDDGGKQDGYWLTDGIGNIVGRVERTRRPPTNHLLLKQDGSWHSVRDFDDSNDRGIGVTGLLYDASALAGFADGADGHIQLVQLDRNTAAPGAALFSDPHYDIQRTLTDDWTGRVIGAAYLADKMEYVYFDPARAALQRGIESVFPGKDAHAVSVTQAGDKAIVSVEAPDMPPTFYFLDRDSHVATPVTSAYPGLTAADLGTMKTYPYTARDGLAIASYLTIPPGRAAHGLPLVVMPHGGPDARDSMRFDWWAQFLANRGYAVFQPNYRGSAGYGRAFTEAGFLQWGRKMQDDITDGVKKLIADGIVDPKRVCIVGDSYGGYAALAGATFTPDLYACAASVAGPSDLNRMLDGETRIYGAHSDAVTFWERRMGTDSAARDAVSPALHTDQVRVPVLLMHGKLDTTVAYGESEEERDALQRAGKKVELVTFDEDDHYLTLASTRIRILTELERFLKENIGN